MARAQAIPALEDYLPGYRKTKWGLQEMHPGAKWSPRQPEMKKCPYLSEEIEPLQPTLSSAKKHRPDTYGRMSIFGESPTELRGL